MYTCFKIEVRIDGHDVLDVLIDGDYAVNTMSGKLLMKLEMRRP